MWFMFRYFMKILIWKSKICLGNANKSDEMNKTRKEKVEKEINMCGGREI